MYIVKIRRRGDQRNPATIVGEFRTEAACDRWIDQHYPGYLDEARNYPLDIWVDEAAEEGE